MSIADGQTVLRADVGSAGVSVDARLSVSRIGSRAFPAALEALAPQIRCGSSSARKSSVLQRQNCKLNGRSQMPLCCTSCPHAQSVCRRVLLHSP